MKEHKLSLFEPETESECRNELDCDVCQYNYCSRLSDIVEKERLEKEEGKSCFQACLKVYKHQEV